MRLGVLADPRAHFAGLVLGVGALLFLPEMAELSVRVEERAAETVGQLGERAISVLGIEPDQAS